MTHCSLYFLPVHVWVTFTAGCFTFSHILVPETVLSHLTFLLYIHLTNKSTSDFVYKEPCHSRGFFMLLGTWLVPAILSGMQGSCHLEINEKGIKLSQSSWRQNCSIWEYSLSSQILWGNHLAFSCHFKHIHYRDGRGTLNPWVNIWAVLLR